MFSYQQLECQQLSFRMRRYVRAFTPFLLQYILSYFQASFYMTALCKCILPFYNHGTHRHTYRCPRPTYKRRNGARFLAQVYRRKLLAPETCQSERGFRLWPKPPAWGRNVQEPKRHVRGPKRPYVNFGELSSYPSVCTERLRFYLKYRHTNIDNSPIRIQFTLYGSTTKTELM